MRDALYTRATATARRILTQKGSRLTLQKQVRTTEPDKPWRAAAEITESYGGVGVVFQPNADSFAEVADITLIRRAVLFVLDNPDVQPLVQDRIVWAGETYSVLATKSLDPDGQGAIVFSAALR